MSEELKGVPMKASKWDNWICSGILVVAYGGSCYALRKGGALPWIAALPPLALILMNLNPAVEAWLQRWRRVVIWTFWLEGLLLVGAALSQGARYRTSVVAGVIFWLIMGIAGNKSFETWLHRTVDPKVKAVFQKVKGKVGHFRDTCTHRIRRVLKGTEKT